MKPGIIFTLMLCVAILLSCSKQARTPVAVLNFRYDGTAEYIEWEEVKGSRNLNTGNLYLTADGFDYEKFHLELERIERTGMLNNITVKNMSFSNNYGFKSDTLRSVTLEITSISNSSIHGKF